MDVRLKQLELTGERFIDRTVRSRAVQFRSAQRVSAEDANLFRVTVADEEMYFSSVYAVRDAFADVILALRAGDAVTVVGQVTALENGSFALIVSELARIAAESEADDEHGGEYDAEDVEDSEDAEDDEDDAADEVIVVDEEANRAVPIDITDKIERMPALEAHLKVGLESLSAFLDMSFGPSVVVRGELKPRGGEEIAHNIELVVAVYDAASRIIGTGSVMIFAEDFFGLETFNESITLPSPIISKVRVYPKKA